MLRTGVALVVLFAVGSAQAADLPLKAAAKAPAGPAAWTGCFVGGQAGAAISNDKIRSSNDFSSTGAAIGGQIGCDYQFAPKWVVGVGASASWLDLSSTTAGRIVDLATGMTFPSQFTVRNDFLAAATARIGYSFAPSWLAYGKGGAAWTHEKSDNVFTFPPRPTVDPKGSRTVTGWTAGAGVEWAFAPHWTAVLEYDYYDFGDNAFRLTDPLTGSSATGSLKDRINTVTVGVNYRF